MTATDERATDMLEELLELGEGLNGWEVEFVESTVRYALSQPMTPLQRNKVEQIWNERIGGTQ